MNNAPNTADTPQPAYTPPAIKGYHKLTQVELDNVNAVKALGEQIMAAMGTIHENNVDGGCGELDPRALAIARTEFQTALMWLTRSITKPETFA